MVGHATIDLLHPWRSRIVLLKNVFNTQGEGMWKSGGLAGRLPMLVGGLEVAVLASENEAHENDLQGEDGQR